MNFHQIVIEIHQNSKFLVILLNFTSTTSTIEIKVMVHAILIMNIFLYSRNVPLLGEIDFKMCSTFERIVNVI